MSDDDAYERFKALRWPATGGQPVCPSCGGHNYWTLVENRKWKCKAKACRLQFTVTSKTTFASRKMEFRDILAAVTIFANGVLGVAACRLIREMGCSYKTAFVLQHKMRGVMAIDYGEMLEGTVEIDGAYFGKRNPRMPNQKELWEKYRAENRRRQTPLVTIRERPHEDFDRTAKVRAFVVTSEGASIPIARRIVKSGTEMHADESKQWESLHMYFPTKRINHSESYSDGIACTNQAESFFSRIRCAERGVYRRITGKYLGRYGWEMAWREERARVPNDRQVEIMVSSALLSPVSDMARYWQRHIGKRPSAATLTS